MSTNVTLHAGHDVAYFTSGQGRGGCAGAMSYYTAAGEPPGQWAGKGAAALGLSGQVDPGVIGRLYQQNIGPGGELLVKRRQSKAADEREEAAVAAYLAVHPYASAVELAEVRAAERGKDPHQVPYFDLTVSAVKSVSVLHASYRVSARRARERGEEDQAAALDARADDLEDAVMESAREAVAWLERHATYTRTGHHSARTGEWRDGGGLVASLFLHHLSRDGDPQRHVHVAIWNRVQRGDKADQKWRTLDSRSLHNQRLAVAPVADRILETKLSALGYAMVSRADGNGAEVGGVSQDVMDLFSSRAVAVTGELDRLAREYQAVHGKPPSRRTLWLLHQQAGQNTRRSKSAARRTIAGQTGAEEPTEAQRLATSTNAARVLEHEGLAESYNIAEFLGKTEGTDELRRPVVLHRDDVLVLDEASQLSTADLAMIQEAAWQAGARITATGDTAQLGAVDAGGMFRLLAAEVPAAELHEVRRFEAQWEREASVRLRDSDLAAVAVYDRHGRIRGAHEEAAYERAASMWLADHLRGKTVLLLAGSNAEAAELSRRVQARLIQLAGHDIGEIIERITAAPMDGARSVSSVLHGRLQRLQLPGQGHGVTWAQRTPQHAPALAHELAAGLDDRRRELGEQALENPEPWLTRHLGAPPGPDASPVLREDYAWRAGTAAAYREARGIIHPEQAVSLDPHPDPELEAMRRDTVRALEIAGEQAELRAMSRGELEGRMLEGDRAQATAPPDVSSQLRLTWQADADAWQQSADADAEHDQVQAANARSLAAALAAQTSRLEAANARYEEWSARTATTREIAGKARAELQRRGQETSAGEAPGPQSMAAWWREFQADADAMDHAIEREHQIAVRIIDTAARLFGGSPISGISITSGTSLSESVSPQDPARSCSRARLLAIPLPLHPEGEAERHAHSLRWYRMYWLITVHWSPSPVASDGRCQPCDERATLGG